MKNNYYVIGVDGGGTKTVAALADLKGKILKMGRSGSSSPKNVGIEKAVKNVAEAIRKILPKKKAKISSVFIGLAAVENRPERVPKIKKDLLKYKKLSIIFKGKFKVASDQIVAFRSGTNKKEGIVLIAGTGCVAHGWRGKKEHKASGWGWLADEGSAFWIGQRVYQAVRKDLDGRGSKTLVSRMISQEHLLRRQIHEVASLSRICDMAANQGDRIAKSILIQAGQELAKAVITTIKKLNFSKEKFPLVLVGGVLKSKTVIAVIKREIRQAAPKVQFIQPKKEPVTGAVKLAIEHASQS